MTRSASLILAAMILTTAISARGQTPSGDAANGAQLFRACAGCHSLVPDRNMTGPSLAGFWGRKAGTLQSFERYSPALKASVVVWEAASLDRWLKAPAEFIPHNRMPFAGIADAAARADLIAFLRDAGGGSSSGAASGQGSGMGSMMAEAASPFEDLKKLGPDHQVQAIRYCHDTYHVTTADGETADFWEVNLRLKTDSRETGPLPGKPVLLGAGMGGDRASVFFSAPDEISAFVKHQC